ncbi:MAG: hypothetical protein WCR49_08885 [Opitutae bacterium]
MLFVLLGFGLVLYWAFWGLGLALWVLPRGWRRFLWAVCVPFGLSFQIALVWWLIRLAGPIAVYGPWANLVPVVVLIGALVQPRNRRWLLAALRSRTGVVMGVLVGFGLLLALLPIALSPNNHLGLTTISSGSRDAPEYAFGARFFLDQGMGTPGAFWGRIEHSAYRTQWMEFNHFGAAALLAMAASTFRLELWQLTSVLSCALGACGAPLVLAFGQRLVGLRWGLAMSCGLLYAMSPLWHYGAYNNALGQMAGTLGIACFLLLAMSLPYSTNHGEWTKRVVAGAIALWLFVSSYLMMIFFVGATTCGWMLWRTLDRRQWWLPLRVALWGAAAGAFCVLLFPMRMVGLVKRVMDWGAQDAGWSMCQLQFPSILGFDLNQSLEPRSQVVHLGLYVILGLMWAFGVASAWRTRDRALSVVLPLCLMIFGAAYLMGLRDPFDQQHNNYKAYKLIAVFLPVVLPSLLFGIKSLYNRRLSGLSLALLGLLAAIYLPPSVLAMARAAQAMPLRVTPGLVALESMPNDSTIASVNIATVDSWYSMWAAVFLAKKELHFAYDSVFVSDPLTGEWTFERILGRSIYSAASHQLGDGLVLRPTAEPALVSLGWGSGWWDDEGTHRWSGRDDHSFSFVLKAVKPLVGVGLRIEGEFIVPGVELHAFIGRQELAVRQNKSGLIEVENFALRAGTSEIQFFADRPAARSKTKDDPRTLLYKVREIAIVGARHGPVR